MTVSAQTAHTNGNGTAVNAAKYSKEVNTARDYYNSDDADTVRFLPCFASTDRPLTFACSSTTSAGAMETVTTS